MELASRMRSRRAFSLVAALLLLSMLAIGPRGALALIQQIGDSPSPATGHGEVIAQGVSTLPEAGASWRVVETSAGSLDAGEPANYGLGFTVASEAGVLINDYTSGLQSRLAVGEAAFTPSGAYQQHASLSGSDVSYLRIGLGGGDDSANGLLYESDSFDAPDGRRDIDLVRDVLGEGESTTVNAGSAPSLVYVLAGEVVIDDGNDTVTVRAGDGMTVNGELSIESQSGQSIVLVAVIGNDVPAPPRISGTVTLDIRACPADVTKEQLQESADAGSNEAFQPCTGLADPARAGLEIDLNSPDDNPFPLRAADLTDEDGVVTWNSLPFGDYSLGDIAAYPDGYNDFVMSDGNLNLGDHGDFTLSRDTPDVYRVIYLLQAPSATGSIEISYRTCRVASFDDFDPSACRTYVGEMPTQIFVNGSDTPLTAADGEPVDAPYTIRWTDLPVATSEEPQATDPGSYQLGFTLENTETIQIVVDGATFDEETGNYRVDLTPSAPDAVVTFYAVNLDTSLGRIYVAGVICPDPASAIEECTTGSPQLPAVSVTTGSGERFDQSAAVDADPSWLWEDLPFEDTYTISTGDIVAPEGFQIRTIYSVDTGEMGDSLTVSNTYEAPTSNILVILDPIPEEEPATPVDTDSDGLSDDDEAIYGTDPSNPDSDTDCFSDGNEVSAGTDPLDAGSFPDGDCDI